MGSFIGWLIATLTLFGFFTISGYKTKEAWDKRHEQSNNELLSAPLIDVQEKVSDKNKTKTNEKAIKIKINRILEDAQEWLPKQKKHFLNETNRITNDAINRGIGNSGPHAVLHIRNVNDFIESIDIYRKTMYRNIQDLLLEINENDLGKAGEFKPEYQQFTTFKTLTENAIDWAKKQNYSTCSRFIDKPTLDSILISKRYIR